MTMVEQNSINRMESSKEVCRKQHLVNQVYEMSIDAKPKIKLCGLSRASDIETANELIPDYIGFIFAPKSKRYVTPEKAAELKSLLSRDIKAVGVFVDEDIDRVAELLNHGMIDIAQLHGREDEAYISSLRSLTDAPIIQAFKISSHIDIERAEQSASDYILLDSGAGSGATLDWDMIKSSGIKRPYFLAGGLAPDNVRDAVSLLDPFAVDVSSGIETDGLKNPDKMRSFVQAVRNQ